MYNGADLSPGIVAYLEDYEREHGITIAAGRASDLRGADVSLCVWATPGPYSYHNNLIWPEQMYRDEGLNRSATVYDIKYREPDQLTDTIHYEPELLGEQYPWAEVGVGVVYLAMNPDHLPDRDQLDLEFLLGEPIRIARSDELRVQLEHHRNTVVVERFTQWREHVLESEMQTVRTEIRRFENSLVEHQNGIAEVLTTLRREARRAEALEMQARTLSERAGEEFGRLLEHPRVDSVSMVDNRLRITISDVYLNDPMGNYEPALMGRFVLSITPGEGDVQTENLDSPRNGRPHPHVNNYNQPCLGSLADAVARALVSGELIVVLELMIEFLESYNPDDDWGRHARSWFERPYQPELTTNEIVEAVTS